MILNEQIILEFRCELEELITRRESLIAENLHRESRGESIAYREESFIIIENDIRAIRERIIILGEK